MRWPDAILLAHLVPHIPDLTAFGAALLAALAMMLLGRAVAGGRGSPEINFLAGWGLVCLVLTGWGIITSRPMQLPAAALLAMAGLTLAVPRLRPGRAEWVALGRILALSVPTLLIMIPVRISMPDSYLNLLPNAAYLYDHGMFPADDRPPSLSFLPGAPYNTQFAPFLGGFMLPEFPSSGIVLFNILLQIALGLLLARALQLDREPGEPLSWTACALGLLLAVGVNPGFTPRISFSAYGEPGSTVMLAAAGWLAAGLLGKLAANQPTGPKITALALVLAGLVNIKQQSPALVGGLAGTMLVLALLDGRIAFRAALRATILAVAPALLLFTGWKLYVVDHFAVGELKLMPISEWRLDQLVQILESVGREVIQKPYFFGSALLAIVLFIRRARRGGDETTWILGLFTGVFISDNVFLLFSYVAHDHFDHAHSYFRYNSHLSLLLVLALALVGREWWRKRREVFEPWHKLLVVSPVLLILLLPIGFVDRLRYDLQMPQPIYWDYAKATAERLQAGDKVALLLPGDNDTAAELMTAVIRWTQPRRQVDILVEPVVTNDTLRQLATAGYKRAILSCVPPGLDGLPPGQAVFLKYETEWHAEVITSDAWRPRDRWTRNLAWAPLCR